MLEEVLIEIRDMLKEIKNAMESEARVCEAKAEPAKKERKKNVVVKEMMPEVAGLIPRSATAEPATSTPTPTPTSTSAPASASVLDGLVSPPPLTVEKKKEKPEIKVDTGMVIATAQNFLTGGKTTEEIAARKKILISLLQKYGAPSFQLIPEGNIKAIFDEINAESMKIDGAK